MDLNEKINQINNFTSVDQKKMIHFNSLRNYIYHYPQVKKERSKVTNLLNDYINYLETKKYSLNKEESNEVFKEFIYPLGMMYYRKHLGFSSELTINLIILIYVIPNLLCLLFLKFTLFSYLLLTLSIFSLSIYLFKFLKKKIYGYQY